MLGLTLVATGCQQEGNRFRSEPDACSFAELSGWTAERERGDLLLRDPDSAATIAVRAVPVTNDWVEQRKPTLVNPAVKKVLGALPQARLSGPVSVRSSMAGTAFEVTFVPPGRREAYLRRHVVLYGDESGKVFHVVLTVPARSADAGVAAFEKVVDSFREEA
jgi:hypothetical protein